MADGMGNLVLLVTTGNSYLMVSLIDKLAERRIRTVSVDADIASIFQTKEKAGVILVYVDQAPIGDEVLVFLRDRADTGNIPIIFLGDKYNIELAQKTISKETSDIIKDYMLGVVEEGTGASAAVEGYAVGGKTGTAEKLPRGNGKYLVSFIGYAPQENPQVMVYVVIDEPNSAVQANSGYATQLASQIMTDIFPYLGIEKKTDSASNTDIQTTQTAQQ